MHVDQSSMISNIYNIFDIVIIAKIYVICDIWFMNVAINILVHFSLFLQCLKSGIKCDKLFTPFCLCQLLAIRLLWSTYNGKLH